MKTTLLVAFAFPFLLCAAETATGTSPTAPKEFVDHGFSKETFFQEPPGTIDDVSQLDAPPTITPMSEMRYPIQIPYGFIGRVSGFAIVLPDGSVDRIEVTHGNNARFDVPADEYVRAWKFSVPTKDGKPVPAMIVFEFLSAADRTFGPFITNIRKKPNKSLQPTPQSRGG